MIVGMHPANQPTHRDARAGLGRSLAIVAVFGFAGPLVGALGVTLLLTLIALAGDIAQGDFASVPRRIVGGMIAGSIVAIILGYMLGTASAIAAGIIVAWRDRRAHGVSLRAAVLASLGLWLASVLFVLLVVPDEGRLAWIGALLAAHLFAGLACGWLARKLLG